MFHEAFGSLSTLWIDTSPDLSVYVGSLLLLLALAGLLWLLPCGCGRATNGRRDEPYYGTEEAEVTGIYIYPVKSCAGIKVDQWALGPRGLEGDRAWMVVRLESSGKVRFVTQRQLPRMILIKPSLPKGPGGHIRLSAQGMPDLDVPIVSSGEELLVKVWGDECSGLDQGDEAAQWLERFLAEDHLRLLHMPLSFQRSLNPKYASAVRNSTTGFADGFPILLSSEESLEDLNARMVARNRDPVPMQRFRPNLTVDGMGAWSEDYWTKIKINDAVMHVVKPCDRCKVPTVHTDVGEYSADNEPTATLLTFRTEEHLHFGIGGGKTDVYFGQNVIAESRATGTCIKIGDRIRILRVRVPRACEPLPALGPEKGQQEHRSSSTASSTKKKVS
jgi:uncharacterized protein YcbX